VGLQNKDAFFGTPDSVVGEQVLAAHFPAGAGQPVIVITAADQAPAVRTLMAGVSGISSVAPPVVKGDRALLAGTLGVAPDSQTAIDTVGQVRAWIHTIPSADAIAGGDSATRGDTPQASSDDNKVIIPLILFVVFLILMLLLRAVVAPLILVGTVVLSFGAAMGLSALVFRHVLGFAAQTRRYRCSSSCSWWRSGSTTTSS
jgi:RND superfamily putative drug exporter